MIKNNGAEQRSDNRKIQRQINSGSSSRSEGQYSLTFEGAVGLAAFATLGCLLANAPVIQSAINDFVHSLPK